MLKSKPGLKACRDTISFVQFAIRYPYALGSGKVNSDSSFIGPAVFFCEAGFFVRRCVIHANLDGVYKPIRVSVRSKEIETHTESRRDSNRHFRKPSRFYVREFNVGRQS